MPTTDQKLQRLVRSLKGRAGYQKHEALVYENMDMSKCVSYAHGKEDAYREVARELDALLKEAGSDDYV